MYLRMTLGSKSSCLLYLPSAGITDMGYYNIWFLWFWGLNPWLWTAQTITTPIELYLYLAALVLRGRFNYLLNIQNIFKHFYILATVLFEGDTFTTFLFCWLLGTAFTYLKWTITDFAMSPNKVINNACLRVHNSKIQEVKLITFCIGNPVVKKDYIFIPLNCVTS